MVRMAFEIQNPVRKAGLMLPAAVLGTPRIALAASVDHVLTSNAYIDFALGIVVGVGVTGGCVAIGSAIARNKEKRDAARRRSAIGIHGYALDDMPLLTTIGGHFAVDYADVAENYVRSLKYKERRASRLRGVRDVLAERLSVNAMDGVPVIVRADGSVGDVGTSWWDSELGDSVKHLSDTPDWTKNIASIDENITSSNEKTGVLEATACSRRERAARIAEAVACIDLDDASQERQAGQYMEQPVARVEEPKDDQDDLWEEALSAMADKIDQMDEGLGVLGDFEGSVDLDKPTAFIPFRAHTGHPEVVDTESYVEYLISDEFSQNSSKAVRKSSHEYLRVLQGGSQSLKSTTRLDRARRRHDVQEVAKPKHMAPVVMEQRAANET